MIKRDAINELKILIKEYPVITLLGPRQSGKTTLVKEFLKGYKYVNLEHPEVRELAENDPSAFLNKFKSKVIIDEIQRVPKLLSYIQTIVDEEKINGRFIITGSHQLQLHEAITQSLAGRTAILTLLPLTISELATSKIKLNKFEEYCFKGFLPRIYDKKMRPTTAYSNYYQTYVERDVRQLINLKDMSLFEKLLKLLAGRVGQIVDYNSLANDVGVDGKTIKSWISILEASYILLKLPAYFENFGKRAIKSPKYYFVDVGLLCYLLGIEKPEHITRDPLVGNIFENLVVVEAFKALYNQGKVPDLYYFRDSNSNEIDLIFKNGRELIPIEIKSAQTFSFSQIAGLKKFKEVAKKVSESYLVYNGNDHKLSNNINAINFKKLSKLF